MAQLAIILVTYNSEKWIEKCLETIVTLEHDIYVIDNHSEDSTLNKIEKYCGRINITKLDDNIGFAKANNIVIQKAYDEGVENFFLLNHDAWVQEDTIEKLISVSKENPEYGVLSPIHLNGTGELLDWNFTNYISDQKDDGRKLYTDLLLKRDLQKIYQVNFVNAAAWLITRTCIEKVGLFDAELLPHYGEDLNYTQRVRFHGLKIGVLPDNFIYHDREERFGKHTESNLASLSTYRNFKTKGANILDENATSLMDAEILFDRKQSIKELLKVNFQGFKVHLRNFKEKTLLKRRIMSHRIQYRKDGFGLKRN